MAKLTLNAPVRLKEQKSMDPVKEFFEFFGYTGTAPKPFDVTFEIMIHFEPDCYILTCNGTKIESLAYDQALVGSNSEEVSTKILRHCFDEMKKLSGTTG